MEGAIYEPLKDTTSIQLGLVSSLFEPDDDNDLVYETFYSSNSIRKRSSSSEIRDNYIKDDERMANNISSRSRHENSFTGKLVEDIHEYIGNSIDACSDYDLSLTTNLRFSTNLFDGEANRFYTKSVNERTK